MACKRQNGLWLSARAAATLLIMGAPPVLNPVQKHFFQTPGHLLECKKCAVCWSSCWISYVLFRSWHPRIHLADYICQQAEFDMGASGINWERVLSLMWRIHKFQGSFALSTRSSDPAAQDLDALELFSGNARLTEAFRGVLNKI